MTGFLNRSFLALLTLTFLTQFITVTATAANLKTHKTKAVSSLQSYSTLTAEITKIIAKNSELSEHQIYISHYTPTEQTAYVYWHQGKELWILPISTKLNETWAFIHSNANMRRINLLNHVVEDKYEIGSSSFLVDKNWASQKIYDAVVNGEDLTIKLRNNND